MNIPKNTLITQLLKIFVSLQVDTDGYEYTLLQEIYIDWKDGLAVAKDDKFVQHTRSGLVKCGQEGWSQLKIGHIITAPTEKVNLNKEIKNQMIVNMFLLH